MKPPTPLPRAIFPLFPLFPRFSLQPLQPHRTFATTRILLSNPDPASSSPPQPDSRWLSKTKARIGKCIMFGLSPSQTVQVAHALKILGEEWRELVAGREGYLVDKKRAGLWRQGVVWGEMDCMNHVNNVTYTRYAESARVNWAYKYAVHIDPAHKKEWGELMTPRGNGLILRSIKTDYKFPMTWPDHVTVLHKLRSLPRPEDTSFILDVIILSELHQRPAARCVEDIVTYNYTLKRKCTIPGFMFRGFEETWRDQELGRERAERRVGEVERVVREVERGSWDREGAVEDMGGR